MPSSRIWPSFASLVVEQRVGVDRLVELADVRVDADLAEQRFHAERARLVGHDRHDVACRCPCRAAASPAAARRPSSSTTSRPLAALEELLEVVRAAAASSGSASHVRAGHEAAQRLAALVQVLHLRAVVRRLVERRLGDLLVGDRNAEPRAELAQLVFVQLLLLVRDVAAFAGLAQAVALDRLGEDDRRRALVLDGGLVGGVDLFRVVAAAAQLAAAARRTGASTMLEQLADTCRRSARGCSAPGSTAYFWYSPSTTSPMRLTSRPSSSCAKQRIPVVAPDDLDDVPAGAAEGALPAPG